VLAGDGSKGPQRVFQFGDSYGPDAKAIAREFFALVQQQDALHPTW
jgi:hypothetical protein